MRVRISRSLLEQVMSLAAGDNREICGLLLGKPGWVEEIRPAANVAADPLRHFEVDPGTLIAAHRAARAGAPAILGHYHSHPSGLPEPSATDVANAAPDGSLWLIIGGGEARVWIASAAEGAGMRFTGAMLDIM